MEQETGILTEVDTFDWITFLPVADGSGAYNRYFGKAGHRQDEDPGCDGKEGRYASADVRELAIHRRVSRMNYSRRCSEASVERAYQKRGISLASGMEIGHVAKDSQEAGGGAREDGGGF